MRLIWAPLLRLRLAGRGLRVATLAMVGSGHDWLGAVVARQAVGHNRRSPSTAGFLVDILLSYRCRWQLRNYVYSSFELTFCHVVFECIVDFNV